MAVVGVDNSVGSGISGRGNSDAVSQHHIDHSLDRGKAIGRQVQRFTVATFVLDEDGVLVGTLFITGEQIVELLLENRDRKGYRFLAVRGRHARGRQQRRSHVPEVKGGLRGFIEAVVERSRLVRTGGRQKVELALLHESQGRLVVGNRTYGGLRSGTVYIVLVVTPRPVAISQRGSFKPRLRRRLVEAAPALALAATLLRLLQRDHLGDVFGTGVGDAEVSFAGQSRNVRTRRHQRSRVREAEFAVRHILEVGFAVVEFDGAKRQAVLRGEQQRPQDLLEFVHTGMGFTARRRRGVDCEGIRSRM